MKNRLRKQVECDPGIAIRELPWSLTFDLSQASYIDPEWAGAWQQ